jgi:hypothetical protein
LKYLSRIVPAASLTREQISLAEFGRRNKVRLRRAPIFLVFLLSGWAACLSPSIYRFEVTPQVLCEGEKAVVSWEARGETGMAVQEETAEKGAHDCVPSGRDVFAFTLVAHRGSEERERRVEVVQLHLDFTEPIAIHTNSIEGTEVVASGDKNSALWDSRVEVAAIGSCQNRTVSVQHAGKTATVEQGKGLSDALAGTPVSGTWELRSPLSAEEQSDPSLRPKELKVLATLRCRNDTR